MLAISSFAALAFAYSAVAAPTPLTPVPAPAGGNCVISWTPDPTGTWKDTVIELMTGDNENMIHLTTVTNTTVDTTSGAPATLTWTCPDVSLYAAVYFYQFSHVEEPSALTWTTRWAIESPTGQIVAPPNATQPDGTAIPWGVGLLTDISQAKPAPSYITGQTSQTSATGTGTGAGAVAGLVVASASASSSASGSTASMVMATATSASALATVKVPSASTGSATTSASAAATTGASSSGAELRFAGSVLTAGVGAVLAGLLALV